MLVEHTHIIFKSEIPGLTRRSRGRRQSRWTAVRFSRVRLYNLLPPTSYRRRLRRSVPSPMLPYQKARCRYSAVNANEKIYLMLVLGFPIPRPEPGDATATDGSYQVGCVLTTQSCSFFVFSCLNFCISFLSNEALVVSYEIKSWILLHAFYQEWRPMSDISPNQALR